MTSDDPYLGPATARGLVISRGAITSNVAAIRERVSPSQVMVVVKAEGYGHGSRTAAFAARAAGADWLGVASLSEGLQLRASGDSGPILAWLLTPGEDLAGAIAADITIGVSSIAQLKAAIFAGARSVHLKLDTGLHRNGIVEADVDEVFRLAARWEGTGGLVEGVFTHLSNATESDNEHQLHQFDRLVDRARRMGLSLPLRHIGGSHGALSVAPGRYEMVRVGIAAYGLAPERRTPVLGLGLRGAMRLTSVVAAVRSVGAGEGVSYDYAHRTSGPTRLALIPFGYADGIPRAASGVAPVLVGGRRHRIAGRVAMDQFVVDVGEHQVQVGDPVVLWGDAARGEPTVQEWADLTGTLSYELLVRMAGRNRIERTESD